MMYYISIDLIKICESGVEAAHTLSLCVCIFLFFLYLVFPFFFFYQCSVSHKQIFSVIIQI